MLGAKGGEEIPETEGVLTQQNTAQTPDEEPLKITTMADKPEEKEEEMKMIQVRTGRIFYFKEKDFYTVLELVLFSAF